MRSLLLALAVLTLPLAASAADGPIGQTRLTSHDILRGRFIEVQQKKGIDTPIQTSGHFTVAPSRGLIWGIEKPFPTSTIITPNGAVQDLGGLAVKLPAKNLRHLYDTVGAALAGDWSGLENDFSITRSSANGHWQMLLTPHPSAPGEKPKLNYAAITVSGGAYVEDIVMTKGDGSTDSISFSDEALSTGPLAATEAAAFSEGGS